MSRKVHKARPSRVQDHEGHSLYALAEKIVEHEWAGTRGRASRSSQLLTALMTLHEVKGALGRYLTADEVTRDDLKECVKAWRLRDGLSAATINVRLGTLAAIGLDCGGQWLPTSKALKWWLSPEQLEALLGHLRAEPRPFLRADIIADYVEWTTWTGLRVEETLRLTWNNVRLDIRPGEDGKPVNRSEITVPGTKTARAQATLALSLVPALVLERRRGLANVGEEAVFPIGYDPLHHAWQHCREFLGVSDDPLSTLKALRRTAARQLTTRGMPTAMLMSYLRHSNIETTMGYLRLVGGYSTAEQRRWL